METKAFLTSIMILFMAVSGSSQSVKREYYDAWTQTRLMAEYQVNAVGEKHGWFKGYNRDGVLIMENNYRNNLYHGETKEYDIIRGKRKLRKVENYKEGLLQGSAKYYTDGLLTKSGKYVDDERDGKWVIFSPFQNYGMDKSLRDRYKYVVINKYYDKGKEYYPDGKHTQKYYPADKIYLEQEYANGHKVGVHRSYYPNGQLANETKYDTDGNMVYSNSLYENGNTKEYTGTRDGKEVFEQYDKEGKPTRVMLNWATSKNALKDAMKAFEDREFAKAAKLFRKIPNEDDARIMDDLANAQSYIAQGSFGGAIFEINKAKKKATNPIIEEFYDEIYPLYLQWLEGIFQSYTGENQIEDMEKQLKHQLVDLHPEDVPSFQKLIDEAKADQEFFSSIDTIIEEFEEGNVVMKESFFVDENGQRIMNESFVKGKYLYPKFRFVIDPIIESYRAETDNTKKRESGNSLVTMIKVFNAIPESDWKTLNKNLKKVDDPSEIKTIIGL